VHAFFENMCRTRKLAAILEISGLWLRIGTIVAACHLLCRGYLLGHYYHKVEAYMKHHLATQIAESSQASSAATRLQEAASEDMSKTPDLARQQLSASTPSSRVKAFARLALAACSPGSKQSPAVSTTQRRTSLTNTATGEGAADDTAEAVCASSASWSPLTRIGSIGG